MEDNFIPPVPEVREQAFFLRSLADALERGEIALMGSPLPTIRFLDLLIDLGLILSQQGSHLITDQENQSVFEDPHDSSDELGNVRMIYKSSPRFALFAPQIEEFGMSVVSAAVGLKNRLNDLQDYQVFQLDDDHFLFDDVEIVELERRAASKRRLIRMKQEQHSLQRSYRKLQRFADLQHTQIDSLQESLNKKRKLIDKLHAELSKSIVKESSFNFSLEHLNKDDT